MDRYEKVIHDWDGIFEKESLTAPERENSGNEDVDQGLLWLTQKASSVIDFGCASGNLLFQCSRCGTVDHIGIDLSAQAIFNAREKGRRIPGRSFRFICGGAQALGAVESSSMDAAVLSNILDNLYPDDAHSVLTQIRRILRPGGRLLVKLNPYLTPEEISESGFRVREGNLLDDGMLLWNNSTAEWDRMLGAYFDTERFETIYYKEYNLYNRLYRLIRNDAGEKGDDSERREETWL